MNVVKKYLYYFPIQQPSHGEKLESPPQSPQWGDEYLMVDYFVLPSLGEGLGWAYNMWAYNMAHITYELRPCMNVHI